MGFHLLLLQLVFDAAAVSCGRSTHVLSFSGWKRSYLLYVPEHFCRSEANRRLRLAPVLLALHAYGGTAESILQTFERTAGQHGIVVVAPQGVEHSWNAVHCCGFALSSGVDDVGFIQKLLFHLWDTEPIEPVLRLSRRAVYAVGFSNGGFMASLLAARLPQIQGYAALAGHIYDLSSITSSKAVSLHWSKDDHFVEYGGCCASVRCCCNISENWQQPCVGADEMFRHWLGINGCNGEHLEHADDTSECRSGLECRHPTRLCSYEGQSHRDWAFAFPDANRAGELLAEDICAVAGRWNADDKKCECQESFTGPLCLDEVDSDAEVAGEAVPSASPSASKSDSAKAREPTNQNQDIFMVAGLLGSVFGVFALTRQRLSLCTEDDDSDDDRRRSKKSGRRGPRADLVGMPLE